MSRTYRKYPQYFYKLHGQFYYLDDYETLVDWKPVRDILWDFHADFGVDYNRKGRDHKAWGKPSRIFKRIQRQMEKAQLKQSLYRLVNDPERNEIIRDFPKADKWNWT